MQVRYLYGRNFGKKKFRFSCGCEISPRWQRNFVWFNESPRAMQRNFAASFGRLFVRTKDEIRRTARSFFLHSTVSVPFSLPPCRRRQYCRFYSLVAEYSLYVYLVTGRGTFQLLILMPLRIIPRYRIVHSLTHPRSLILVTDRVQTLILSCLEQILTVTIEMKAYEQCFCMVLRGRKMKFQRFRVYCLNES